MNRSKATAVLFGLVLMASFAERAAAWGNDGHKIVCRIAYLLLDPQEQAEVDRLTRLYRKPDGTTYRFFTDACTFADLARNMARDEIPGWTYFSRFNRWHFLNVPRSTQQVRESHCGNDCVLEGIGYHSGRLADHALPDWKRAEALFFLGHWLGDIHQPLHVSFEDDLGGNDVQPIKGGFYSSPNLHSVWDSGILGRSLLSAHMGWLDYAAHLKDGITPTMRDGWLAASPLEWAQESYAVTIAHDTDYCDWEETPEGGLCSPEGHVRRLTSTYQNLFRDDVDMRLQQAGVRLAERIRAGLAD